MMAVSCARGRCQRRCLGRRVYRRRSGIYVGEEGRSRSMEECVRSVYFCEIGRILHKELGRRETCQVSTTRAQAKAEES